MKLSFAIKIPFSITNKLLLITLTLICVTIAATAYLSYRTSAGTVTRLSRDEQLLRVKSAAAKIGRIFETSCLDLATLSELIGEDFSEIEKKDTRSRISKLIQDFVLRSPYYLHISLFNASGKAILHPGIGVQENTGLHPLDNAFFWGREKTELACGVSTISFSRLDNVYTVQIAKPLSRGDPTSRAKLVLELNFSRLIDLVNATRMGKLGFAFLVDQSGRTIAHPLFDPYQYDLSKYDDPLLREVIVDMILGETAWRTYRQITLYAVAFTPVPSAGWSLALSVPMDEFNEEVMALRRKVIEFVIVILAVAISVLCVLSYQIFKPMRNLAVAAKKIAEGNLGKDTPVSSDDEVGSITRSINRMAKKLRETRVELARSEKLISLGRLSAGVAHEVRNPLNAVKGAIIVLQKRRSGDSLIQEYTQLILEEIGRLNKFVNRFLYFAKQSPPNREPTDVNDVLKSTIAFLEEEFKRQGILLSVDLDRSLPVVRIDPHQMEQVFLNVMVNAMHAMPEGGTLIIKSAIMEEDQGGMMKKKIVIHIQDSGMGIPERNLNNVFDLFFSTKEDGTGLGLPISLGIIEDHGGKMEISSQEGKGTTITLELPLEEDHSSSGNIDVS